MFGFVPSVLVKLRPLSFLSLPSTCPGHRLQAEGCASWRRLHS